MLMRAIHNTQEANNNNNDNVSDVEAMKAKIIAHPHYSTLLQAYLDCQKVWFYSYCYVIIYTLFLKI